MKCILSVFLFLSVGVIAQNEYNILPQWKKGDVRHAKHVSNSTISVNGEVIQNMDVTSDFKVTVVDVNEFFTLEFTYDSDQFDVDLGTGDVQDSSQFLIQELVNTVTELSKQFVFRVLVDKTNGQAFEMVNAEEFISFMKEGTLTTVQKLIELKGLDTEVPRELIDKYVDESAPQMIETMLNSLNYLFQCYSYICEIDGTISEEVSVEDVNAGRFGWSLVVCGFTYCFREEGEKSGY